MTDLTSWFTEEDMAGIGKIIATVNRKGDESSVRNLRVILFGGVINQIAMGHPEPKQLAEWAWREGWPESS